MKPGRVKASLVLSKALHTEIKLLAVMEGRTLSEIYEEALREYIIRRKMNAASLAEDYPE